MVIGGNKFRFLELHKDSHNVRHKKKFYMGITLWKDKLINFNDSQDDQRCVTDYTEITTC
jgi:hypothetical protein